MPEESSNHSHRGQTRVQSMLLTTFSRAFTCIVITALSVAFSLTCMGVLGSFLKGSDFNWSKGGWDLWQTSSRLSTGCSWETGQTRYQILGWDVSSQNSLGVALISMCISSKGSSGHYILLIWVRLHLSNATMKHLPVSGELSQKDTQNNLWIQRNVGKVCGSWWVWGVVNKEYKR